MGSNQEMSLSPGHSKVLCPWALILLELGTGGRIEPKHPEEWGLWTDSKQHGELQLPPAVPSVESRDRGEGWGFLPLGIVV